MRLPQPTLQVVCARIFWGLSLLGLILALKGNLSTPQSLRAGNEMKQWNLNPTLVKERGHGLAQMELMNQ